MTKRELVYGVSFGLSTALGAAISSVWLHGWTARALDAAIPWLALAPLGAAFHIWARRRIWAAKERARDDGPNG